MDKKINYKRLFINNNAIIFKIEEWLEDNIENLDYNSLNCILINDNKKLLNYIKDLKYKNK